MSIEVRTPSHTANDTADRSRGDESLASRTRPRAYTIEAVIVWMTTLVLDGFAAYGAAMWPPLEDYRLTSRSEPERSTPGQNTDKS
jgi:hypothetical protein